jgi:hypothetical protein
MQPNAGKTWREPAFIDCWSGLSGWSQRDDFRRAVPVNAPALKVRQSFE